MSDLIRLSCDCKARQGEGFVHFCPAHSDTIEELLVAAYKRGADWRADHTAETDGYLAKAARDYADATVSQLEK